MSASVVIAQVACGGFFLTGLVTGIWKYRSMITSSEGKAPVYVDICHRSALMYSFGSLVLAEFARLSVWSETVNAVAVIVPVFFFGAAVASYALHGLLRDTDNMLRRPHVLGEGHVHGVVVSTCVYALAVGEVGGFLVLFSGFIKSLVVG